MSKGIVQAEERLLCAIRQGSVPHACFISCPDGEIAAGIAKKAAALHCTGTADEAMLSRTADCIIPSCYKKEAIREEVIEELGRGAFSGGRRAVLLLNASDIDPSTQNILLKTIEEPPNGVLFLLTGNDAGILPTILSRCVPLRCGLPSVDDVARELMSRGVAEPDAQRFAAQGGTVSRALRLSAEEDYRELRKNAQDAMALLLKGELPFDRLPAIASADGAHFMLSYMRDMLLCSLGRSAECNPDRAAEIAALAPRFTTGRINCIIEALASALERLSTNAPAGGTFTRLFTEITEEL